MLKGPRNNERSKVQLNRFEIRRPEIMNRSMFAMVALVVVAGCQTAEETAPAQHETFTVVSADARSHIHKIAYGETAGPVRASGFGYSFLQFEAKAGDNVDVLVTTQDGHAVAFLIDADGGNIGRCDQSDGKSRDAHLTAPIAADGSYYIAFRDRGYNRASFFVTLKGSGLFNCASDADCVAVPRAECCPHGYKEAVNARETEAYLATYACAQSPRPLCSRLWVQDSRVAQCDRSVGKCAMVAVEDIVCGGFANLHSCPEGYACQAEGPGADRLGKCVASAN